jgi:hypothetical protein
MKYHHSIPAFCWLNHPSSPLFDAEFLPFLRGSSTIFNHYSTIIQPFWLVKPWFSPHLFHPSVKKPVAISAPGHL